MEVYDYIVVGGGSAGCTITYRLVKAGKRVLMLEAGPDDDNQFVHIPGGFVRLFSTERVQFYLSEPQGAAGGHGLRGRDANEIEHARISMMARSSKAP
jgi:choline dehydrogenase